MSTRFQNKRDTAANWTANDPVLLNGEIGYETDTGKAKIGDGSTTWASLAYSVCRLNGVVITGGSITGITDLAVADGGTGTSTGSITGTGALTFAAGGSGQNVTLTPSGAGYTLLNGSVGIGTPTPAAKIHVITNAGGRSAIFTDAFYSTLKIDHSDVTGIIKFLAGDDAVMWQATGAVLSLLPTTGSVGIGTAIPTEKVDIANGNLCLTDADVSHGMTDFADGKAYFKVSPLSATAGGALIRGLSDTGTDVPLVIEGTIGNADPTDSVAAITLIGSKKNGTGSQALGALETALKIQNANGVLATIFGNGHAGFNQANPQEDVHASDTIRADVAFNLNGTDGTTQAASAGTIDVPTALAGGIVTAHSQITYAADGTYANPTSITISKGIITAIS